MVENTTQEHDVLIIGGGPAGATAAMVLARAGVRVAVLEKTRFPRLHVGESFLAKTFELMEELDLISRLRELPHTVKLGAEFGFGNARETTRFAFDIALEGGVNETFNIERAPFDKMLLDTAREAGACVLEDTAVKRITHLADGEVRLDSDAGPLRAKFLIDASGQSTVVAKHLGTRRVFEHHRKIAYFGHFHNVKRLPGAQDGYPTIVMCDEGWFWLIPIDRERMSIGLVMDADAARRVDRPAQEMLSWGIERCPLVADKTARAVFPETTYVLADFSYTCKPFAGPGYFLVGDAAIFLDPIFSTGVCLGMVGAAHTAKLLIRVLKGDLSLQRARRKHCKVIAAGSTAFFKLVEMYYDHAFRELFLHGYGPLQVHRAIITLLAGHVFPKPSFAVRWRVFTFEWMLRLQKWFPLVPRRQSFSLFSSTSEAPPAECASTFRMISSASLTPTIEQKPACEI